MDQQDETNYCENEQDDSFQTVRLRINISSGPLDKHHHYHHHQRFTQ